MCLSLLALLAACGTPQEQCIRRETRDIRTVEGLISEVSGNLTRGYAIRRESYEVPVFRVCSVEKDAQGNVVKQNFCWDDVVQYRNVPVAIDVAAEQRKLADLKGRRAALVRQAAPAVAQCKTQFPEA